MATIRRYNGKKGTTYQAIVRRADQPAVTKTFKRRTDAKAWATKTESAMDSGTYSIASRRYTLRDLSNDYYENADKATARRAQVDWWLNEMGEIKLANIRPDMIAERALKLKQTRADGKPGRRSVATVNRYLAALSALFTYAAKTRHWIDVNPASLVQRESEPAGRVRFLSDDERNVLLKACQDDTDPYLYEFVLMAITTGARAGELLKLEWTDLDFAESTAYLTETKNGTSRKAPIASSLKPLLRERRGIGKVFPFEAKTSYRVPFDRAIKKAGVTDFRFHDCRHTAASYLAQSGASLLEIAQLTGHKSLSMVQRYAHLDATHVKKMGSVIEDRISGDN